VRVVVVGAGAIGTLLAARLAAHGHAVTVVARAATVPALRHGGLTIEGEPGPVRVDAVASLPEPSAFDAAVLAVKTFDLEAAAEALARAVRPPVPLLLVQNGLGVEAVVERALQRGGWSHPASWTVRAVNSLPATWIGPGEVRAGGTGEVVLPGGSGPGGTPVDRFAALLGTSGISVRLVDDLATELWRKAIVNGAINPLTAIGGVENGALLAAPWRARAMTLLHEAVRAARASGIPVTEREAEADWERVVRATAANRSSMLQDLDRGRPTEIDAISGAILAAGAAHGLDLPATRAIVADVRARARPQPS